MDKLIDILDSYRDILYCIVPDGGVSHIILMLPYLPYKSFPADCIQIDAFYVASNKLYHTAKEIVDKLVNCGYNIADSHIQLKQMAELGGLGTVLDNQLLINAEYGTKTTLQSITVSGEYRVIRNMGVNRICDNCRQCTAVCPGAALNAGKFDREKCLRHIQDHPEIIAENMGRRVLGCDECQRVCPYNAAVGYTDIPADIVSLLNVDNMLTAVAGGRAAMTAFADVYGRNYARPAVMAMLIINSLISSGDYTRGERVRLLLGNPDARVRGLAEKYMTKCLTN